MLKIILFTMCVVFFGFSTFSVRAGKPNTDRIVVMMDITKKGVSYFVNSKPAAHGILRSLSEVRRQAPHQQVFVLVSENASLHMINNLLGIMNKAGMTEPRVFYYGKDKEWMVEITNGCTMIYSNDFSRLVPVHGGISCKENN